VTKSPGTNSPVSSTKKQRSASPSNGDAEVGALLERLADDELAVLRAGAGSDSWFGNDRRLELAAHGLDRKALEAPGWKHPPSIPFAAPITTLSGLIVDTSKHHKTDRPYAGPDVVLLDRPLKLHGARLLESASRTSNMPDSPPTGSAPRRTSYMPVYSYRN
jgi:hypothetical protein